MIRIEDKKECTGCGVCTNACLIGAIDLKEDEDGFRYPVVNLQKCINCGKCVKVCPMQPSANPIPSVNKEYTCEFYAGQLFDKEKLFEVSSGGAFLAFAKAMLDRNGVVYGVEQADVDQIHHIRISDKTEIQRIQRSKYLQSDVGICYSMVRKDLLNNKTVLFSGTGCQIAALNQFLGKEYENLYTCDVVCHGVPSMLAWRQFRKELEEKTGKRMKALVFRDKSAGWSKNQYKIDYTDGTCEKVRSTEQDFHSGYLQGLFYRPSCGSCHFAHIPRVSDVTLADYWKYRGKFHSDEHDVGVSLIVINNHRGKHLLDLTREYLDVEETSRELALSSCKHLDETPIENSNRTAFLQELKENGYYAAAKKYILISSDKKSYVRKVIAKIKRMVK